MSTPASILVLDDEERIRRLMLDFLEDFDEFEVRACPDAEQALDELAARPAALCIVDMRLPGMNGLEFIRAAHGRCLCPRFILHTGSVDFTLTPEARALGLAEADVFYKPCDMDTMLARMRVLLRQTGDAT